MCEGLSLYGRVRACQWCMEGLVLVGVAVKKRDNLRCMKVKMGLRGIL